MISEREITKVAKLARLKVSDQEISTFSNQLNKITDLIDQLKEVDNEGVEPVISVCQHNQPLREDVIDDGNIQHELFQNVPEDNGNFAKEIKCFIVPKMVE